MVFLGTVLKRYFHLLSFAYTYKRNRSEQIQKRNAIGKVKDVSAGLIIQVNPSRHLRYQLSISIYFTFFEVILPDTQA